jgi:hypothetical protein
VRTGSQPLLFALATMSLACGVKNDAGDPEPGDDGESTASASADDDDEGDDDDAGDETTTSSVDPQSTGGTERGSTGGVDDDDDDGPVGFDLGPSVDAPGQDQRCQEQVDVVFVMDVSTSMGGFLSTMADEMLAVDLAIQDLGLDTEPRYGLAVFVDDYLLVNDGMAYDDVTLLAADFDMWSMFTASNSQVNGGGFNTTFPENSIDPLYAAATEFDWSPLGMTTRIVIHTTDDTFWDGPTMADGEMIQHSYVETVDALQDEQVRVFSFAAMLGGPGENEDVTMGWFGPYGAEIAIPEATDGGVFSIDDVLAGTVSLGDAIVSAVEDSYCEPYTPQG